METEWTLCFVSVQIFYIDILFLRQWVAVFSDETPSPVAELASRKGGRQWEVVQPPARGIQFTADTPQVLPRIPCLKWDLCEWVQTGDQAVTRWFVPRKTWNTKCRFPSESPTVTSETLVKTLDTQSSSSSLSSTDNRSSEASLNSNKSKGILPICSHALFYPYAKHMVAFKLGTFLSQLCHRFQEWLCISHLAFVQFAGCRKSQPTAFFSFWSREIQYSDEHNNLCIKQMCKRQDHNLYIQTLFH